jgi:hypothetical protein
MQKEYIILERACKNLSPFTVTLTTQSQDNWDLNRIQASQIDPADVSKVSVGPETVFIYYETPTFEGATGEVINNTPDTIQYHDFGCETATTWKGTFKSFIVMTYDNYNKVYGIKYCNDKSECGTGQYCLCPKGQEHPSWCPQSKRRCMNWAYFTHESPIPIISTDEIYIQCLEDQMKQFAKGTKIKYDVLKEFDLKCALDKRRTIEGFSFQQNTNFDHIVLFVIILILFYFVAKHYHLF